MPPSERRPRLLILGGTREAAELAARAEAAGEARVLTSLAGRTTRPAALAGRVRVGGFGGAAGLAAFLEAEGIDLVIDATHPFAAAISAHAAEACREKGVPRLALVRPAWKRRSGERWIEVGDAAAAAAALPGLGARVFLTLGARGLEHFAALAGIWFLVRLIERPARPLPLPDHHLILGRGPFDLEAERALTKRHRIDALVTKASGGEATYAKITAARLEGVPVVMIRRPPQISGESVASVDQALAWLAARRGS